MVAGQHVKVGCVVFLALALMPTCLQALNLQLPPQAVQTEAALDAAAPYGIATGPASVRGPVPLVTVTGPRRRTAWRIAGQSETAAAVFESLNAQIRDAGYVPLFTCETSACGGFDFRLSLPVLSMPSMFVDLGDFMYASAALSGSDDGAPPVGLVSVLVSRSNSSAFVQITEISQEHSTSRALTTPDGTSPGAAPPKPGPAVSSGIAEDLLAEGRVALDDLTFQAGSSRLSNDADGAAQLRSLAEFLAADPARRIALVGHSDWTGGLDANITLSRARATSVATALTGIHGIPTQQIVVEGIGFLAPRRANTTERGLQANRRVEVVLLPDVP